jgi:hypothetical protein
MTILHVLCIQQLTHLNGRVYDTRLRVIVKRHFMGYHYLLQT